MRRRLAILIGNQSFLPESGLLPLQGPVNDVAAMERLLGDPERGNFEVCRLLDRPHHEITRLIEKELGNRGENELVLIYYSGHGKPDIRGRLCLATADTSEKTLLTTSIGARHLLDIVEASFHNQVVIILDCCYSARIGDKGDPSAELQDKARATSGLFILTSSDKQQISREETAGQGGEVMGVFTSALLRCVQSEAAVNEGGEIRLRALLPQLEKANELARQKPKFFAQDASGDPLICRFPGFAETLLDPRLLADLTDAEWHRRLGAVTGLGILLNGGTLAQRGVARKMLEARLDLTRPDHEHHFTVRPLIEQQLARSPAPRENADAIHAAVLPSATAFRTTVRALPELPMEFARPGWASGSGRDHHGTWATFTLLDQAGQPLTQSLRWIPPGRFRMGSPPDEPGRHDSEGPQHDVTIATGFWLFDTPVTQALWQAVMGDNPSYFNDPKRPVENVSFEDVQKFLAKANATAWGRGLVLPSEAQWEYACRAGTDTATYAGTIKTLDEVRTPALDGIAWYRGNCRDNFDLIHPHAREGTRKVAQKVPNPWGLHDMLGNVDEWCEDSWHDSYYSAPADGSAWVGEAAKMYRGGSWSSGAERVRAAYRNGRPTDYRTRDLGFRCCVRVQT